MTAETDRLFFALWPDDSVRKALAEWQNGDLPGAGRWIAAANLHLTLLFAGNVNRGTRQCLSQAAGELTLPCFSLTLSETGVWRKPQVAWLGAAALAEPVLQTLVNSLREIARECGLQPENRDFLPHVTLGRKIRKMPTAWHSRVAPAIHWPVREFVLVRSITCAEGVQYQPVVRWPLSGSASDG